VVNRVKGKEFTNASDSELIAELRQVFDETVEIRIQDVDLIPQERSGKYRFSICKVA